jgi:type IV pilus assembly protein PilW
MRMRRTSSGFSLVELMIALTIGLAVLSVLATVFQQTSSGRADLDRITRLVENSRFAVDIIADDVKHAGFYGTFLPPSDAIFTDASPCDWDTADVSRLGWQPTVPPLRFPAQLQGWDDPGAATVTLNCLPDRVPGTDVLAVRRVSSQTVTPAQVNIRNVYVQASQCINDPTFLRVTNTAAQFTLRTAACDVANLAAIRRYFVRVYYVASCNECAPSDGIRTLKRMEIVENVVRVVSLAEGVENAQFEYAFDIDDDGTPNQYLTFTGVAGPTSLWSNVVAVRAHILMRSTEAGLAATTTPGTFDLGPGHQAETCPNGFKCRLVTTTMRLSNVAGRREI